MRALPPMTVEEIERCNRVAEAKMMAAGPLCAPTLMEELEEIERKYGSAFDVQIGGDHYKELAIQPIQYALKNNLGVCEHMILKYITRHKKKGGREDLLKARHYIDILIESEYPRAR